LSSRITWLADNCFASSSILVSDLWSSRNWLVDLGLSHALLVAFEDALGIFADPVFCVGLFEEVGLGMSGFETVHEVEQSGEL